MTLGSRVVWFGLLVLAACSSKSSVEGGAQPESNGQAVSYSFANGKTLDCAALRATPPGEMLMHVMQLSRDPADGQAALEACLAHGPHPCDRAWVGWAIFGGASMAVAEGVAPPLSLRARWFGDACRALPATQQACLVMSRRFAQGGGSADACKGPIERVRAAMGRAQAAHQAAERAGAPAGR